MSEIVDHSHPLTKWIEERQLARDEVARSLGISRQALARYEHNKRRPQGQILDDIVRLTDGAVDANAWLGKEAAEVVLKRADRV